MSQRLKFTSEQPILKIRLKNIFIRFFKNIRRLFTFEIVQVETSCIFSVFLRNIIVIFFKSHLRYFQTEIQTHIQNGGSSLFRVNGFGTTKSNLPLSIKKSEKKDPSNKILS